MDRHELGEFVHACDAMIHARVRGETFGMAGISTICDLVGYWFDVLIFTSAVVVYLAVCSC